MAQLFYAVHGISVTQMIMTDHIVTGLCHFLRKFIIPLYIFQHPVYDLQNANPFLFRIIPAVAVYHMHSVH